MNVPPEDLVGLLLNGVSASWQERNGERSREPVHVWLSLERVGSLRLHTSGDGSLEIAAGEPHATYDMLESGSVAVDEGPELLVRRVGQRIRDATRLRQEPPGMAVGVVLHFLDGSVGLANLGDELVIDRWPGQSWSLSGVFEEPRA